MSAQIEDTFFVVAREAGSEQPDLPTWTDRGAGNIAFDPSPARIATRREVSGVPGAFQLLDVLTPAECEQFISTSERLGYNLDAPVSLPHSVRHNTNINWIVDQSIDGPIWERCKPLIREQVANQSALGLNARFRFYRYGSGDFFAPHTDGAWPGSRVIDGALVHDAYGDRLSQMSFLLLLSDGYAGGRTLFFLDRATGRAAQDLDTAEVVGVETPKGAALCFPHGFHPLHCLHAGEEITSGTKYIIRTDVLYG